MKYRVWCKNKREYERDQTFLTNDGRLFQEGGYGSMQYLNLDNHIIEQFSELKDKNGTELYEGDFVGYKTEIDKNRFDTETRYSEGVIAFEDGRFGIKEFNENGGYSISKIPSKVKMIGAVRQIECEIVGNVHDKNWW